MAHPLTKTDFERIAGTLRDLQAAVIALASDETSPLVTDRDNVGMPPLVNPRLTRAFAHAAKDVAIVLAKSNGKFEATRFISQCEVE